MKSLTPEQKTQVDSIIQHLKQNNFTGTPRHVWEAMFERWPKDLATPDSFDVAEYVRSLNHG